MSGDIALPEPAALSETQVDAAGLSLKLRIWGDRTKPLLLLQHGGKDHGRSWDWTVTRLMDDYCLAVPDLRGHGDSAWPLGGGYDNADFVADMAFIVEHLVSEGFEAPFTIIGHSLGGNIALNYAAAQPHRVKSVVSIEGMGFSQKSYDEITQKSADQRLKEATERRLTIAGRKRRRFATEAEGIERLASMHKQLSRQQAEHLARHALVADGDGGFRWKHDSMLGFMPVRPMPPAEYAPIFGAIEVPVLLLYGGKSWASNPEEDGRTAMFQDARFQLFENAGHWLHHDQFEDFMAAIEGFLRAE